MFEAIVILAALPFALFTLLWVTYGVIRGGAMILENLGGLIGLAALLAMAAYMIDPHGVIAYARMIPFWGDLIP